MEEKTQLSQSVSLWCMGCLLWYHIICSERTFPGDLKNIFHRTFQIINNKSLIRVTICRAIFDDVIRGSLLIWKHGVWRELRAICTTGAGAQSVHQCAKCGTQSVHQCKISTIRCLHTPCTMHWRQCTTTQRIFVCQRYNKISFAVCSTFASDRRPAYFLSPTVPLLQ